MQSQRFSIWSSGRLRAHDEFPWQEYAEAAQLRGIPVDADAVRDLPYTVLLSDELTEIYEF